MPRIDVTESKFETNEKIKHVLNKTCGEKIRYRLLYSKPQNKIIAHDECRGQIFLWIFKECNILQRWKGNFRKDFFSPLLNLLFSEGATITNASQTITLRMIVFMQDFWVFAFFLKMYKMFLLKIFHVSLGKNSLQWLEYRDIVSESIKCVRLFNSLKTFLLPLMIFRNENLTFRADSENKTPLFPMIPILCP